MRKLSAIGLVTLLPLFSVAATPSNPNLEEAEIKHSGDLRLRYTNLQNPTAVKSAKDSTSEMIHRLRYTMAVRKGEFVGAQFTLLHQATWGNDGTTTNSDDGTPDAVAKDNIVMVNRAWGWWKATDSLLMKAGRIPLEVADGSIYSENEFEQVPTSHEGVQATYEINFARINFFGLKSEEYTKAASTASVPVSSDPEKSRYGITFDIKNLPEIIKTLNILFVQTVGDETASQPAVNTQRIGLTAVGEVFGLFFRGTYAVVNGKLSGGGLSSGVTLPDREVKAHVYDAQIGYQNPDAYGIKLTAGFHQDSGDGNASDSSVTNYNFETLFYDRHNYGGYMDVWNWGNLSYFELMISASPIEDLEVGVGAWMFSRTETGANSNAGGTLASSPGANFSNLRANPLEKNLGTETDIWLNRSFDGGFKGGVRAGAYFPGEALKNQGVSIPQGFPAGSDNKQDQTIFDVMLQGSASF